MTRLQHSTFLTCVLCAAFAGVCAAQPAAAPAPAKPVDPKVEQFEQLVQKAQSDPLGTSEAQARQLLQLSVELNQPYTAHLAIRSYLRSSLNPSLDVLRMAADNARLAGDFSTAIARYKAFLKNTPPNKDASESAAWLYHLLVDFTNTPDDAYETMKRYGDTHRQSMRARKFDDWYLNQAQSKRDYEALATRLAVVLAEKAPIEAERLHYWHRLDWLMREITRGEKPMFDALPAVKRIVPLVREDDRRTKEYNLYLARLQYRAGAEGKDKDALAASFKPVVAAAKTYFDAYPDATALNNIVNVFCGGYEVVTEVNDHVDQKHPFFLEAFGKLNDADRAAVVRFRHRGSWMHNYMASPAMWADLAAKHTALFRTLIDVLPTMSFDMAAANVESYKKQAPVTEGVISNAAAVINSLAAGGDDLNAAIDHLMAKESWWMNFTDPYSIIGNNLWPYFTRYTRADDKKLPPDYYQKAMIQFGQKHLSTTPMALFDTTAAKVYVEYVWSNSGNDYYDKSKVAAHFESLNWVPWADAARKQVFSGAYDQFKKWTADLRQKAQNKDAAVTDAVLAQITPLENLFKKVMDSSVNKGAKAPNPLCEKLAASIVAGNDGKAKEYEALVGEVYAMVDGWDTKRTPLGRAVMTTILRNEPQGVDLIPLQAKAIVDHAARFDAAKPSWPLDIVVDAIIRSRPGWSFGNTPADAKARVLQLNDAFATALTAMLDRKTFHPAAFAWWNETRYGNNWYQYDRGEDLMARLVDEKTFVQYEYRPIYPSATASYTWLVQNRTLNLRTKYPPDRHFDDMFLEESAKRGWFDWQYWVYGRDQDRKIANAVAAEFAKYDVLPLGYGKAPETYTRGALWDWYGRATNAEPKVRDEMLAKAEAAYGKTRFDEYAMGRAWFALSADVKTEAGRKAFFDKLKVYVDRAAAQPSRVAPPFFGQLATIDGASLTDAELDILARVISDCSPAGWYASSHNETLVSLVYEGLLKRGRMAQLFEMTPHFWKISQDVRNANFQRSLASYARQLVNGDTDAEGAAKEGAKSDEPVSPSVSDLANVMAAVGLEMMGTDAPEDVRTALLAARSRAMVGIGGVIPVPRGDARWPIYASQAAFMTNKTQEAWDLYLSRRDMVMTMLKDLDPNYLGWIIDQNTNAKEFEEAEKVARAVLEWTESTPQGFDPEVRASLVVAYANISLARQEYPRARAWFERIAAAKEFEGTRARRSAELKIAEVDRVTKQYEAAATRLEKLVREADRALQADAYYQLAMVRYDQEDFLEANTQLEEVFARVPSHPNARILQGELNIRLRKLDEAREVAVGLSSDKRFIVPGRKLRVSLEDRNLAIVKGGANIEIRAWTDSGDEELFSLFPKGDSKTKFEGELATEMGAAKKNDRTLQLLGNDTVYYNFSPRFLQQRDDAESFPPTALQVVSDSQLFVSAGRILTPEELEERALEDTIRQKLRVGADALQRMVLDTRRDDDQIKPGNKINVRVIDFDRNVTAGKDKVAVSVETSSGDRIGSVELVESDPFTGVFEGAITTSTAQATAYASDSEEGRDPNFAISSGDFPAWVGLPDNRRPKTFSVDLNDNVGLRTLTVLANVPGRKIKDFQLQTSINGRDFTTVGRWPTALVPWDGSPRLELVRYTRGQRTPATVEAYKEYLEKEYITLGVPKVVIDAKQIGAEWNNNPAGQAGNMRLQHQDWYIAHFHAAFYVPRTQMRTFKIDPENRLQNIRYILAIDGKVGDTSNVVTRSLEKGVHRVDVFMTAYRHANPKFTLLTDSPEPPYMIPCPPEMFDPAKTPEIKEGVYVEPAKITASEDNGKFDIAFSKDTRGRVVRMLLADFETDAPAIAKITLVDEGDRTLLPTKEDFLKLKQNDVLEIVPGDRITVSYTDPKVLTKGRESQSAFMSATFSNAELSACFVEYQLRGGDRQAEYVPMRRFKAGDAIKVFIRDPDADETDAPDVVEFTVKTETLAPVKLKALETAEHSGIFMGTVLPVLGEPGNDSEVKIAEGEDVVLGYFDRENTDPGVPIWRTYRVEQAHTAAPQVRVYEHTTVPLTAEQVKAEAARERDRRLIEYVPVSHNIVATRPQTPKAANETSQILVDGPLLVELIYPGVALSPNSRASIYAQTSTARAMHGLAEDDPTFDVNVPGTVKFSRSPGDPLRVIAPEGYRDIIIRGNPYAADALDEGRFTFEIPIRMGEVPDQTLIMEDDDRSFSSGGRERSPLLVRGNDVIHVGFQYTDAQGQSQWVTQKVALIGDIFFHSMDRRYQDLPIGLHVGETAYFRIIHKTMDTTDDKDTLNIELATASGGKKTLPLVETYGHSGIFKGLIKLVFADDKVDPEDPTTMAVVYGDKVTGVYTPSGGEALQVHVDIFKGADGQVLPFTKRFKDPEIAVQTQFTIAEAFFELAKRHRDLGQESLARREIAQGKKLLEEALRDYPDTEARAQAEYLLANLAFEFAKDAKNEQMQKDFYVEAIGRFGDIVASFPDNPYAPKSQYKKALVLEQMGQIDEACEEYVKLSFRYPDNELVAETIARLGNYFLTKGRTYDEQAAAVEDPVEREKIKLQAKNMFTTAAQVLGRLSVRFPEHNLSAKTTVLSAQCYMRAEDFEKAIAVFKQVYQDPKADNELASESMYWAGDCYMKQNNLLEAYRAFKKLTWDYPESKWAKFARGRLTDDALLRVGEQDAAN